MEVEAWFLGIPALFTKIDSCLTIDSIKNELNIDLSLDPEKTHYHPAEVIRKIYESVGKPYDKHTTDVSSIVSQIAKEDYEDLLNHTAKCSSFRVFIEALEIK